MKKILFISEQTIKDNSIIETAVDSKILSNTIYEVQDLELKPILGKELYNTIAGEILSASTVSGYTITTGTQELLDDYIQPFLIYGTLSYGFIPIHYKLSQAGVNRKNSENATTVDFKELQAVKDNYDTKFDSYKQKLVEHLSKDLDEPIPNEVDTTADSSGWYLPDNTINLDELFEGLANKRGGYFRRY